MINRTFVESIGQAVIGKSESFRSMVGLLYDTLVVLIVGKNRAVPLSQLVNQILFIGVDALLITLLIGVVVGCSIAHTSLTNMDDIGASSQFGVLMVYSIICELGPFLTTVVVVGRSGSALTTFLGNMKVAREIDALESMGIDVAEYLVLPAFLGMIISLVALNFYFGVVALFGGVFFVKVTQGVSFLIYFRQIVDAIGWGDLVLSIMKSALFGAIVAVVSSYHGLVVNSLRIVPRAVYRSVVTSITAILIINSLMSVFYYGLRSKIN